MKAISNMIFETITLTLLAIGGGCGASVIPGSCSRSCNETINDVSLEEKSERKFLCSCSPSCEVYRDCCYDSPYRKHYWTRGMATVCLPALRFSHFLAVRSCPKTFRGNSETCKNGSWNLSPVTSLKTGITYANIYCAMCNVDNEQTISWNATLRCCPLAQGSKDESKIMRIENTLWKLIVAENGTSTFCECKYGIDQEKALNGLEVRSCGRNEKSTCSIMWEDLDIYSACKSYIDPIHVQDTIYRNVHCAICNHLDPSEATCASFSVNDTYQEGLGNQQLGQCSTAELRNCLLTKGGKFSFSELFQISTRKCLPPQGSRCCAGEQYDFKRKRCRKTTT